MRAVFEQSSLDYRTQFVGQELSVLWESATPHDTTGWMVNGLTDNYLRVTAQAPHQIWNQITPVRLTGLDDGGMVGMIIP